MVMGEKVVDITPADFFSSHKNTSSLLGVHLQFLYAKFALGVPGQQLKASCL